MIFEAALSMFRACKQTGDPLGLAVSQGLFSVSNEWEKDHRNIPDDVLDAAFEVALEWEKATLNNKPEEDSGSQGKQADGSARSAEVPEAGDGDAGS